MLGNVQERKGKVRAYIYIYISQITNVQERKGKVRAYIFVCACVCVRARAWVRDVCVYVCVYIISREKVKVQFLVSVCGYVWVCIHLHALHTYIGKRRSRAGRAYDITYSCSYSYDITYSCSLTSRSCSFSCPLIFSHIHSYSPIFTVQGNDNAVGNV